MSESRERILNRLLDSQVTATVSPVKQLVPQDPVPSALSADECLACFCKELDALEVDYYIEDSVDDLKQRLQTFIAAKSLLAWDQKYLPYGIADCLENENCCYDDADMAIQSQAEVGVTGCDFAIAETGSIALLSAKGKPASASLLPFTHVAVLRRADLVYSLGEMFAVKQDEIKNCSHLNIITGPSKTADIEMVLTVGAHGPGKLIVIIGP